MREGDKGHAGYTALGGGSSSVSLKSSSAVRISLSAMAEALPLRRHRMQDLITKMVTDMTRKRKQNQAAL